MTKGIFDLRSYNFKVRYRISPNSFPCGLVIEHVFGMIIGEINGDEGKEVERYY